MTNILVIGLGTIGSPLARIFERYMKEFSLSRLMIYKHSPRTEDVPSMRRHLQFGTELVVADERERAFREIGLPPSLTLSSALEQADVIVDCSGQAMSRLDQYQSLDRPILVVSQGSEELGKPYAYGINHDAGITDRFRQVVSCNTHATSSLVKTLAFDGDESVLQSADFTLLRRDSDDSETSGAIHGIEVGKPAHQRFGSHHAEDAHRVFMTLGKDLNLYSTAIKTPQPFMHVVNFTIRLTRQADQSEVVQRLKDNPLIAVTDYRHNNQVSSIGREWGAKGRIYNHVVVSLPTISVDGNTIRGAAFTPQDGNSLLSSVAIVLQYLFPSDWRERMIEPIDQYTFSEI